MAIRWQYLFLTLTLTGCSSTRAQKDAYVDLRVGSWNDYTAAELRDAVEVTCYDVDVGNQDRVIRLLAACPKLETLMFYECDLSALADAEDAPLQGVAVHINRGEVSQDTMSWLARSGASGVSFGSCDLRGLQFAGVNVVMLIGCTISHENVLQLVGGASSSMITFTECELEEANPSGTKHPSGMSPVN